MMQNLFALIFAAIAFGGAKIFYGAFFDVKSASISSVTLEQTIKDIKSELLIIGAAPGQTAGLQLDEVKVELLAQTETKDGQTGQLKIPVFSEAAVKAGSTQSMKDASTFTVVFEAPEGNVLLSNPPKSTLNLSDLVLAARKALLDTIAEEPKLIPKSVEVQINFVLSQSSTAAATVKAHVVNIGSNLSSEHTASNSVTLSYKNPAFAKDKKSAP